ncbi:serine hydrolase domain-containing protein [Rhodococcus sp. WAY2]|uniref:serine hydrolase domain-containing protein n=1 Tax=Rhodococcus sp. WAY2 TaxID=2663121 RepID=UPI00131F54B8|nr:serine hydrolase domain-containing protein [Rhodococcus sp. WAY2]QHE66899.1 Beta-lactamase class C-related penicillin binding protein [Rhodococcus sp. WAY2]
MTVSGHCNPEFRDLRAEFEKNISSEEELGASIVVDVDGEIAVDLWGGFCDSGRTRPWNADTITNVWSSTKSVTSLAVLMLVDRGLLDVRAPVAQYWPEFAANGKDRIELRHLLSHTSGVAGWEPPFGLDDLYDWELASSHLAAQAPWWEPGTASGYHAQNYGQLLGEVVRRVSGKSLAQFVADEIAAPLGADFQIGARESDWPRIADVVPPPPLPVDLTVLPEDNLTRKSLGTPPLDAAAANTAAWRRADLGAYNGHGNARSLARIMSAISRGGTVDGVTLLTPDTIDLIFEEQSNGVDVVLGSPLRFGIGYGLPHTVTVPYIPDEQICFWGGWGGSMVVMDLDRRMTVTYAMNKMGPGLIGSPRSEAYLRTVYRTVDA